MRYLLPMIMITLAGCGPIPVQMTSQSSKQTSRQEAALDAALSADMQSAHQSDAKQGTNSMPVIIICNTNNSPNASCATLPENSPLVETTKTRVKRNLEKLNPEGASK
jgi:hypothetical protein